MAIDQGAAVATATAVATGVLGVAARPPMSTADFGWFTLFALGGILARHAAAAAQARGESKAKGVARADLPTLDWLSLTYDSLSAPFLGIVGWALTYYAVLWLFKVQLDKSVLMPAAMTSGYIGAEWIRFLWNQIRGLVSSKTGVAQ